MAPRPNIFTVSPGRPFLEALAGALLAGELPCAGGKRPSLLDLPAYTILLPTRRATRALQEAFLAVSGSTAMLLPAMRPIAESDEDQGLIEALSLGTARGIEALELPPAVGKLERRLVLIQLIMLWSKAMRGTPDGGMAPVVAAGAGTPAQAAGLAAELASLMDTVETENVTLDRLKELVPEHLSEHWQLTVEFLRIITEFWPVHLRERGYLSPMERRNRLILAEARRLMARPPANPVIVAGVTGSIPATTELMRAVLGLPNGAIVLPGLDMGLDEPSFTRIGDGHFEHPQHGFWRLLRELGIARADVAELPGEPLAARKADRNRLISEALRPTGTMDRWRTYAAAADRSGIRRALDGVNLLEAATAEDEAEAIALILRETAETPGRTAALVSPDRLLARRVAIRLEAWGIRVDDSAGRPFAKTVPGTFLDLVAEAWAQRFAPAELMALLKHPLTRLGFDAGLVRRAARNLEISIFRTPYLGRGLAGIYHAVERAAAGGRRQRAAPALGKKDWDSVRDLVARLYEAFAPLEAMAEAADPLPLRDICLAHIAVAEAVARPAGPPPPESPKDAPAEAVEPPASPLWSGEAGEAASRIFESLTDAQAPAPTLAPRDYPDFYRALIAGEAVRSRVPVHPRLSIWGPLEARLQQPDVVVLGSLNEGTWPQAADPGAWLNRPMRAQLGLPAPEEEIGRAAHDISTLIGADTVVLTRADKVDGVPRVPSRWLLRLKALLEGLDTADALTAETSRLAWARHRTHIARHAPVASPEPRPELALRPRRVSVSDIETWMANPYAIYAKHVLRLYPLSPLGVMPGPQEKGIVMHAALAGFTRENPLELPDDIAAAFLKAAAKVIRDLNEDPRVRAFWQPRLARFAAWLAAAEPGLRGDATEIATEVEGSHLLDLPGGPFKLTARADRLDVTPAGLVITDYKTGSPPTDSAVRAGLAPQLPLEAAIAIAGGFTGLGAATVAGLRYIRATGGEPPGEHRLVNLKELRIDEASRLAIDGVVKLVSTFDDPAIPFRAVRRPGFSYEYDDYAHLARVDEWAGSEGEE